MKEQTRKFLEKAARAIVAARTLLREGDVEFSAGRAYYAMFHAAQVLLNEKGLHFRRHGGIHAAFGEHFAKTSEVDPRSHRWLLDAFDERIEGDYGLDVALTTEEARRLIERAAEFLREARRYLGEPP